ncbi:unnamed protein product [Schistocephalus solidus]|uniref:Uncharacterized protein n=1 Tax=Schistocephalus solidus TaxID=70667 RepID=A0A183SCI4_SCHSO|nr:unnamed protein product [Schistocephalus solidus]
MQDAWMVSNTGGIRGYADRNETKKLCQSHQGHIRPLNQGSRNADGTKFLTETSQILKRWAKHFLRVRNCSSAIFAAAIDQLPQVDTNNDLDLPPSLPETFWIMQQISRGKAPESNAIPQEVYKHGGSRLMAELKTVFQEWWHQ